MESYNALTQLELTRALSHITIFSGIGINELNLLADKCVIQDRDNDEIIIEQGDRGDCLYFIMKGRVKVTIKHVIYEWVEVNTLGPGDVFGEIAILRQVPRTARITTISPCTFLTIDAKNFMEIYQYFPPKSRDNIQLVVAKRLQQLNEVLKDSL